MKERGNVFMAMTDKVQLGTFSINKVDVTKAVDDTFDGNLIEPIFDGDQSKASELFGWALATMTINMGQDVLMLFSEDEEIVFPDGIDIK